MKKLFIIIATFSQIVTAEIMLPSIFSEGAIFQCDKKLPIWGWATPGQELVVSFAGQTHRTLVQSNGTWKLKLDPIKGSYEKHALSIKSATSEIKFSNILVGEVWLCSGQSNMMYTLDMLSSRTKDQGYESVLKFMRHEKNTAKDDFLRQIKVPNVASVIEKKTDFEGQWLQSSPQNNGGFSGTAYFFGKELRTHIDLPVGLINVSWGGKRIDSFIAPSEFDPNIYEKNVEQAKKLLEIYDEDQEIERFNDEMIQYKKTIKSNRAKGLPRPRRPQMNVSPDKNSNAPGSIYNGMINPVVTYAIRGATWYQGESHNQNKPEGHSKLLEKLIRGWRNKWQQGNFPFYFCQLANLGVAKLKPLKEKNTWVVISNQLRLGLKIPNTGMAVLHDVGQVKDIHPVNKYDVGKRLSKWALYDTYKFKDIVPSGPLFKSAEKMGSQVIVNFGYSGSGLMVGNKHLLEETKAVEHKLSGFEICGENGEWKYAEAKIISTSQISINHKDIDNPTGIRYAWRQNPLKANLYNIEGLPAALFSTRDFVSEITENQEKRKAEDPYETDF